MKLIICIMFTSIVSSLTWAQEPVTLRQAITSALQNKGNIRSEKINAAISDLKVNDLRMRFWPQVSAEYNHRYYTVLPTSILPVGAFDPSLPPDATRRVQFGATWQQDAGLTVTQPLVDFALSKQLKESKLQTKIHLNNFVAAKKEISYEVARTYFSIWLKLNEARSAVYDSASTFEILQLQKKRYANGQLLKIDLNDAVVNHQNAVVTVKRIISEFIEQQIYLNYLMGKDIRANGLVNIDTTIFNTQIWFNRGLSEQYDSVLEIQEYRLKQELSLVKCISEKSRLLPSLYLKGFLGANQFSNKFEPLAGNTWFGTSYIGLTAKWDIWNGQNPFNRARQRTLEYQQYGEMLADKKSELKKNESIALSKLESIREQMSLLKSNAELLRESIAMVKSRYSQGQVSASELNRKAIEASLAMSRYNDLVNQGWLFWLDTLNASGNLWLLLGY